MWSNKSRELKQLDQKMQAKIILLKTLDNRGKGAISYYYFLSCIAWIIVTIFPPSFSHIYIVYIEGTMGGGVGFYMWMSTSWNCFELFIHLIHIYCGQKLLGPGYTIVKAWMELGWVNKTDDNLHTWGWEDNWHRRHWIGKYKEHSAGSANQGPGKPGENMG